jgi:hypothetical protein
MAKNYTLTFKSLRAGTVYTLNIGGGTGTAVPLKPGAQPFTTEEDENDDQFTPVRTQSGYLRIIDDGKDANNNAFNWKDLIPATDTSRPVTLTHVSGGATVIDWVGFMQAQDFGSILYGNPQEREFPVQCVLSVICGTDINYDQKEIQNFAYLLKQIVDAIPAAQRPTQIMVQGNTDAQQWLLKRIDWQNFVEEDGNDTLSARFDMMECLEDMCTFWGWTARTCGQIMYLTRSDDASAPSWLTLTYEQLATMAGGTAAGSTGGSFVTIALSGDIFANTDNEDTVQRGASKAVVKADGNAGSSDMDFAPDALLEKMKDLGTQGPELYDDKYVVYTNDMMSFTLPFYTGTARANYGSFNIANIKQSLQDEGAETPVIMIKKSFSSANAEAYASMETVYHHCFSDGYIMLKGYTYRKTNKFEDVDERETSMGVKTGNKTMMLRLGIGTTRGTAKWWNGRQWSDTLTNFVVTIGNSDNIFRIKVTSGSNYFVNSSIRVASGLVGKVFLDFLGSSDLDDIDGQKSFEISDFEFVFSRNEFYTTPSANGGSVLGGLRSGYAVKRDDICEYKSANNNNNSRDEFNADCIYASDNDMSFGYGVLINADNTYFNGYNYGGLGLLTYPEQHLANRVAAFWATSKRKMRPQLRLNTVNMPRPNNKVSLDGTLGHPIAISHQWRDDILTLTILEQ